MKISRTASFGIGVVVTLVIGSGTAYAATGGTFLLGKSNSASTTTVLSNSRGTALSLSSKAGTAPLKVNRATKVTNLNSDQLDGLDSTRFALATGTTRAYDIDGQAYDLDQNGLTDTIIASGACPSGSSRTGGGMADFTQTGFTLVNAPDESNSWTVMVAVDEGTAEDPTKVTASVVCLSMRGTPSGGFRVVAPKRVAPSKALLAKVAQRLG
jgi:hypothetical protein